MNLPIISIKITYAEDMVLARQRARLIAGQLGFEPREQIAIATSVSEIVRNAFNYANGGLVEFYIDSAKTPALFMIKVTDNGTGIENLDEILGGQFISKNGMGLGILGARKLMDSFHIESRPGSGTMVLIGKRIPAEKSKPDKAIIGKITDELNKQKPHDLIGEMQQQNHELVNALDEIKGKQDELLKLNRELEETNRGVIALYAELDERAEHLKRMNEVKARFLSNMSHEFKTPLNSILALSRILLNRIDGELNEEQSKQVTFIKKSAGDLSEMVNDLLDIAKLESGKLTVKPVEFDVKGIFSALRGMMRPLQINPSVKLIFRTEEAIPYIYNDESKISQVLRNLISNALKFTEKGEVIVSASMDESKTNVIFSVSDTGIGIAPEDQPLIFEEFAQVDSELQKKIKGTGLGLPLSKKLAELLGGELYLRSTPGKGSTFYAKIPMVYCFSEDGKNEAPVPERINISKYSILLIEDDEATLEVYHQYLAGTGLDIMAARSLKEARAYLALRKPLAIVLDLLLPGKDSWKFLTDIKSAEATKNIPVLIVSELEEEQKAIALGAEAYCKKPVKKEWLLMKLSQFGISSKTTRVLVIDDEEIFRYVVKEMLSGPNYEVIEAGDGMAGLQKAEWMKPDVIMLDIALPDLTGFEVLDMLKENPLTRDIPVIINTSKVLDTSERERLFRSAEQILVKKNLAKEPIINEIKDALAHIINQQRERNDSE